MSLAGDPRAPGAAPAEPRRGTAPGAAAPPPPEVRDRAGSRAAWRFAALHVLLLAAILLPVAHEVRNFALDDFFITYRYADNLAHGEGFRYNPGEEVFGTTAPGHGLLLAALAAVTRAPLPILGTVVTAVAIAWLCALLIRASYPRRRWEAVLAVWLIVGNTFLWLHNGGELFVVAALLVTAGHLAARRPVAAGVAAGLAVWCRPDAGLGVAALGLLLLVRHRRLPHRFGWTAAAVIGAGLLAARAWFGSFLPGTLEAKRLQVEWLPRLWQGGEDFWPAFLETVAGFYYGPLLVALAVLGLVGWAPALRHGGDAVRALVLWAAATVVAYPPLGVAMYPWYGIPLVLALTTGFAYAVGGAGRAVAGFVGGRADETGGERGEVAATAGRRASHPGLLAAAAGLAVAAALAWPLAFHTYEAVRGLLAGSGDAPRLAIYRQAGRWMDAHAPADARLAAIEVGTIAYYSRRHVHDILGLVSPSSLPGVAAGDLAAAFRAGDPDWFMYYLPQASLLDHVRDAPGFEDDWQVAHRIEHDDDRVLLLYRRRTARPAASAGE